MRKIVDTTTLPPVAHHAEAIAQTNVHRVVPPPTPKELEAARARLERMLTESLLALALAGAGIAVPRRDAILLANSLEGARKHVAYLAQRVSR